MTMLVSGKRGRINAVIRKNSRLKLNYKAVKAIEEEADVNLQPLEDLAASKKVIGAKQTLRALEKGMTLKVYLASDADRHVVASLADLCKNKGIEIDSNFKMAELGKACEISVGAAAVAVLK